MATDRFAPGQDSAFPPYKPEYGRNIPRKQLNGLYYINFKYNIQSYLH